MSSEQMRCTRTGANVCTPQEEKEEEEKKTQNTFIGQLTRRDEAFGKCVDRRDVAVAGSFN